MKRLWLTLKEAWWKAVLIILAVLAAAYYLYRLVKPAENSDSQIEAITTEAKIALTEAKLRGKLEKDRIGTVKRIFETRLSNTEEIEDREERLRALVRLYEELDI